MIAILVLVPKVSDIHLVVFVDIGKDSLFVLIPLLSELILDVIVLFGTFNDPVRDLGELTHIALFDGFFRVFLDHELHIVHI